ncbi:MAG: DUF6175 family protein [Syntrophothermus sp.]
MKKIFTLCFFLFAAMVSAVNAQSNLPRLREATFLESYSPTEVTLKAKGLGDDVEAAEADAKKCGVYFMLYNATDRILQSDAEKSAFASIEDKFFADEHISSLITFMADNILSKVNTKNGVKVEKLMRINKGLITEELTKQGVIASREELTQGLGNPFIMVVPEVPKGENPIAVLQGNPNVKKGAEVIEGYLTARKYDVQVPEQAAALNDLVAAQNAVKGVEEDISYKLALSVGADVYITYNVHVEKDSRGSKGVVGCRAYETTTAKLLGTETGYSQVRPGAPDAAVIEEAMNDAIDKVLNRINAYWKDDLQFGQQYKLIMNITGTFSDAYAISDAVDDVLKEVTTKRKQNMATEKVIDYIVWQKKFENTGRMFRELKKKFDENSELKAENATVKRINVNRKLMILSVENGG